MSYWTLVTTRNRSKDLARTLDSILSQQLPCYRIVVLDDGSTDDTLGTLERYADKCGTTLRVLRHPDWGYDIKRVVRNWNECLAEAQREGLDRTVEFVFVTADDCVYPPDYVRTIVGQMKLDPLLVVASGTRGIPAPLDGWKPPEGSGRLIRNYFLGSLGYRFPEKSGYEPWIVYEAMRRGFRVMCINELSYEHLETFGSAHGFEEWGYMPHALGYHPLFFAGRCMQNLFSGALPRRTVLSMLGSYIRAFFVRPCDPFYQPHDAELREFVRSFQEKRIRRVIARLTGKSLLRVSS